MKFNQSEYIKTYNKEKYKMYQFRVKKDNDVIKFLDSIDNRNKYLLDLIENDKNKKTLTISFIKKTIKPILNKYGIDDINLFGSYARGEANNDSDVDIYCNPGNIKTLIDQGIMEEELQTALNKDVDIVFSTSEMDEYFRKQIMEDMIKLC